MSTYLYEYEGDTIRIDDFEMLEGLDYVAESELTASGVFAPENVTKYELIQALRHVQKAAEGLNIFKKVLFRKQSRTEAGLFPNELNSEDVLTLKETLLSQHDTHADFFHGIIGAATETGELCELLADVLEGKRRFDVTNTREEIGDVLWYLARLVKWADTTFLSEMKRNIAKLRARHGAQGFSKEGDMNRDLEAERKLLEGED